MNLNKNFECVAFFISFNKYVSLVLKKYNDFFFLVLEIQQFISRHKYSVDLFINKCVISCITNKLHLEIVPLSLGNVIIKNL